MTKNLWNQFLEADSAALAAALQDQNPLELLRNPFKPTNFELEANPDQSLRVARTARDNIESHFIPIESFKTLASMFFRGQEVARTFQSSGTTAQNRSQSFFSNTGLNLYKKGALATFFAVMEAELGCDFWNYQGFSLIPPTSIWTDSSLAQMVSWIGEFTRLKFTNFEEFTGAVAQQDSGRPVWVFGTAFHFMNLIDQGLAHRLPAGSVIIETGGTKGKSRELSTKDFHEYLMAAFGIEERQIIGEYGMCELASQAYRFSGSQSIKAGSFLFPSWVKTQITSGLGIFKNCGSGTLSIYDPLRSDYPWSIRTQDMGDLYFSGEFNLLGRVPGAVLKGCSLLAEDLVQIARPQTTRESEVDQEKVGGGGHSLNLSMKIIKEILGFLTDGSLTSALTKELGCGRAAAKILADMQQSVPKSEGDWRLALQLSHVAKVPTNWLYILPNSHPIAGIYPLIFGALGGLKVWVRIPKTFSHPHSSINLWIDFLQTKLGAEIFRIGSDFRIGLHNLPQAVECLLCFGSTETVADVAKIWGNKVAGFGSSIGMSLLQGSDDADLALLVDDMLGLGQMGCLSSRGLLVSDRDSAEIGILQEKITNLASSYWDRQLSLGQKLSLDCEEARLQAEGIAIRARYFEDEILVPYFSYSEENHIQSYLSAVQFVLPIINCGPNWSKLTKLVDGSFSASITFSTNISQKCQLLLGCFPNITTSPLGRANQPPWDGTLHGKPLFLFNDLR